MIVTGNATDKALLSPIITRSHEPEPRKDEQRDMVASFFHARMQRGWCPKFATLPGARWVFERHYRRRYDARAMFIGSELGHGLIDRAAMYMPMGPQNDRPLSFALNTAGLQVEGHVTSPCVSLNLAASATCHLVRTLADSKKEAWRGLDKDREMLKVLRHRLTFMSGAWWDFTSCLCPEVEETLRGTHSILHPAIHCPIAVTVMKGRESAPVPSVRGDPNLSRAVRIASLLNADPRRRFTLLHMEPYRSDGGANMLTVFGISSPA